VLLGNRLGWQVRSLNNVEPLTRQNAVSAQLSGQLCSIFGDR